MTKLICFFILIASAICTTGCSAQKGIGRHYAFFRKTSKGVNDRFNNTPVTSKSQPKNTTVISAPDTTYLIFLETIDSSMPLIDAVNVEGELYNASVIKVLQNPLQVGKTLEEKGEQFAIMAEGKKQWWQIRLNNSKDSKGLYNKSNEVIIKGLVANKPFQLAIKLKELEPEARM